MHYLYDFFSNATVEGYRVIESKSAFSFSENMYVFDNDYINEFLKLKENCTSVLEFEKDLNFKLQKRLEIIFNYLINNNWSLKFLMSIDDFIIRQVGINESNLLLLEKVNKQVLSFATKEKGNLDFWFSNRKSLLN